MRLLRCGLILVFLLGSACGGTEPGADDDCGAGQTACDGVCVDLAVDPDHCGECGRACADGQSCADGACACPGGRIDCDGRCIDPLTDDAHCGTGSTCEELGACEGHLTCRAGSCGCPDGRVACGGECIDPWNDPAHCGTGTTCEELVACGEGLLCESGSCTCPGGLVDCDGRCIDPLTDTAHCGLGGTCAELVECPSEFLCVNGACTCPGELVDCDGRCIDPRSDEAHCGTGATCEELVACGDEFLCVNGACTCPDGLLDCDGRCIDPRTDVAHCGIGTTCAELTACPVGALCAEGVCTCPEGQASCAGSCTDILGDPLNCNGCGVECPPGGPNTEPMCSSGACDLTCALGYGDCDGDPATGCETALAVGDAANCGGCGVTCGETAECLVDSCVDRAAPYIVGTTPAAGAQDVDQDAPITLAFSEPVDYTGDWFAVSCTTSGSRGPADFRVASTDEALTLVPNTPFERLETCTVTVYGAQITDQDPIDPPDAMVADYQFSFDITDRIVLLAEDFEDGIPPDWTLFNLDGRTPATSVAYVNAAWVVRSMYRFGSNNAVVSTSWYSPAGAADDWMMTPAVALPAGRDCRLDWWAFAPDASYPDGYEVRVSTTDATPAGALANPALLVVSGEESTWTARSVGLAGYGGSTVYVAFRNNSNDKFLLYVDDVRVSCRP
jgi:hypothetical protein